LSHRCDADWGGDVTVTGVPVTTRSIFPNNYTCIPQTTCNDATVHGMGGEEEVTEYLCDDTAMMNYFFACDGRRHDFASSDYFCAYKNQYFDFTMGTDANYFNFISTIQLWTATIIMVAAFVLHFSTASTTNEVGMKSVWAGLVEIFSMTRINLLEGRNIFE